MHTKENILKQTECWGSSTVRLFSGLPIPRWIYTSQLYVLILNTARWLGSPHYIKDKELLERVQRRFPRMIPELKDLPYAERLEKLNLWTLEERRVRADLIEVYKVVHHLSAVPFEDLFEFENSSCTRGYSLKLWKKRCRLDLRLYFFSERVANLWTSLDEQPHPWTLSRTTSRD